MTKIVVDNPSMTALHSEYPWLAELEPLVEKLVKVLHVKEKAYAGSWQNRGGIGAFMMLARKWDRIESIAGKEVATHDKYDILEALACNFGDIEDDVEDLICYLMLCLAYHHASNKKEVHNAVEY